MAATWPLVACSRQAGRRYLEDPPAVEVVGERALAAAGRQHGHEHVRVEDVPVLAGAHGRAPAVADADQSPLFQGPDGLPGDTPGDAHLVGQIDLALQHVAGREPARDDVVRELLHRVPVQPAHVASSPHWPVIRSLYDRPRGRSGCRPGLAAATFMSAIRALGGRERGHERWGRAGGPTRARSTGRSPADGEAEVAVLVEDLGQRGPRPVEVGEEHGLAVARPW